MKKQVGFTLIELAIVLVIIGLLLGGVLKGQELINSAKAKSIIADFKNAQIFIYAYQDKFKAIPGDDANANKHINNGQVATTPATKQGDGVIGGEWDSVITTDESYLFWQHVRLAGLATGSVDYTIPADYAPKNADGGRIGVQSISGFTEISGMTGLYVACSGNISGKLARQIDANLDDGETSTGNVRVGSGSANTPVKSTDILDGTTYIVCLSF